LRKELKLEKNCGHLFIKPGGNMSQISDCVTRLKIFVAQNKEIQLDTVLCNKHTVSFKLVSDLKDFSKEAINKKIEDMIIDRLGDSFYIDDVIKVGDLILIQFVEENPIIGGLVEDNQKVEA